MTLEDADRRTHKPTPKRVQDFRKRGEIARSRDLTALSTMTGGMLVGALFLRQSLASVNELSTRVYSDLDAELFPTLAASASAFAAATVPVTAGALAGYLLSTATQLGSPPAFTKLKLDITRVFSVESIFNLVGPKAAAGRALKATAKVAFVGLAAYLALSAEYERFLSAPALEASALIERIVGSTARLSLIVGGAFAVLGVIEYAWSRRGIGMRMRMTSEEIKRELKEQEGDPAIKRRRRQRMRELARRRLSLAVKSADVVVVNPTEYAVALRYRPGDDRAPKVVAKGRRAVAERIRELARNAGVPIMAQPPLARFLYKAVREGQEIPGEMYRAVAEVLAYVHRLKRRAR